MWCGDVVLESATIEPVQFRAHCEQPRRLWILDRNLVAIYGCGRTQRLWPALGKRIRGFEYDEQGYSCQWEQNVLNGMPIGAIAEDFGSGAGRELDKKLCAAHFLSGTRHQYIRSLAG